MTAPSPAVSQLLGDNNFGRSGYVVGNIMHLPTRQLHTFTMFSVICSSRSSRISVFEEKWYTTRSTNIVCRSIAASSVAYRKKCGCLSRRGNGSSALRYGENEKDLLTVRERLHRKFPLDLSSGLHDLPETWENVIVLNVISDASNIEGVRMSYLRKDIPKDLEKLRLLNSIEACLYVHLYEV